MTGSIAETLKKNLLNASHYPDILRKHEANRAYNQSIVEYLVKHNVQPLQTLLVGETPIKPGTMFWVETTIAFQGAGKAWEQLNYYNKVPSYFSFRINFEEFENVIIEGQLNAEHLYTTSSVDQLSRIKRKFLFGHVQEINGKAITVRALLIGDRVVHDDEMLLYEPKRAELNIHAIDEFREIKRISHKDPSLDININKTIPEKKIKQYLAEIIAESGVDKDWGGEQSDLFTTHLHVDGQQLRAAFVLKGPSKFHKMQVKDLGKNGDQIARLFDEPADIFILQHCHDIASSVIKTMDAFANQINRPRKYCIINGIDTLRLFKAYHKLP
ncbi:hypothetical protein [Mucilaginibacter ginsenosidivorans]|uniref:Uncharacterized protein n=1 Tax=Mucilaginibacter ginsenosidivorans TaxID=398053 RepID=A0A5B8UUF9_9SPHI|nr:hypothetical protein [Mucilaginibacter ginsenosidivorans]QEC62405.1 hypothetical protein FRZ54_07340 [Mucilaginibacter ginsenosidivorans]